MASSLGRNLYTVERSDGIVFRCNLTGSDADRWLEIPAWMFDRSACARAHVAAAARADLAALTTLAALLRYVLNDSFASSNARVSRDQNRAGHHAKADEADVGARQQPRQVDLFGGETQKTLGDTPAWSGLPTEIRAALTDLMTRLIQEHANSNRNGAKVGHDL